MKNWICFFLGMISIDYCAMAQTTAEAELLLNKMNSVLLSAKEMTASFEVMIYGDGALLNKTDVLTIKKENYKLTRNGTHEIIANGDDRLIVDHRNKNITYSKVLSWGATSESSIEPDLNKFLQDSKKERICFQEYFSQGWCIVF